MDEVVHAAKNGGSTRFYFEITKGYDTVLAEGEHHFLAANANVLLLLEHCFPTLK